MKLGSFFSLMASSPWIQSPPIQHALSSMGSVPCTMQFLSGSSPSPKLLRIQTPVSGVGNRMTEPKSGCHIGQIWKMSARDCTLLLNCGCVVACKGNCTLLDFAVPFAITIHCGIVLKLCSFKASTMVLLVTTCDF